MNKMCQCPKAKDGTCEFMEDCPASTKHEHNLGCETTGYIFRQGVMYNCPICVEVEPEQCPECGNPLDKHTVGGYYTSYCPKPQPAPQQMPLIEEQDYSSGLLNDYGGGNVGWWQDYVRCEIGRCNDYWQNIIRQHNEALEARDTAIRKATLLEVADDLEAFECPIQFDEYLGKIIAHIRAMAEEGDENYYV